MLADARLIAETAPPSQGLPAAAEGVTGGHARNRTGVRGFAVRCVTTPPRGPAAPRLEAPNGKGRLSYPWGRAKILRAAAARA